MEPDPQRERDTPSQRAAEQAWSPYDELAAREDAEWRRRRRRRSFAWLGVVLLVMCLIGSVVGYIWYDRATRPDRSTPAIVVEQYIYAVFGDRNFEGVEALECSERGSRNNLQALLAEIEELERKYDVVVTVSTANYSSSIVGKEADVKVALRIDVPEEDGKQSRSTQQWQFQLRDDDGWRVCAARRAA